MGVKGTYQAIHCIYQVINLVVLLVLNQVLVVTTLQLVLILLRQEVLKSLLLVQ